MNYLSIGTRWYQLTQTNSSEITTDVLTSYIRPAEDRVQSLVLQSDGRWQFDDPNNTDFPIATFDLVSGQADYALDTSFLKLIGISVKGSNGIWRKLQPFDAADDIGPYIDRAEYLKTNGFPYYYDLIGASAVLYPAPDNGVTVTLTAGGKFYYQRAGKNFDYTTSKFTDGTGSTSSSPGFNSLYHDLIPLWAAYNYCIINLPSLAGGYMNEIQRLEAQLILDYSKRDKDERPVITSKRINHR